MQRLMGQGDSTLGSLLHIYENEEGTNGEIIMETQLLQGRQELIHSIRTAGDSSQPLKALLELKCPVSMKYAQLDVPHLLRENCQSMSQLKTIPVALGMLEKYGRHLLKPPSARVNLWRQINFNNAIFKERVLPMQGSLEMVQQMGYSVPIDDGLRFAADEPNPEVTSQLVADILLARTEMERYLTGKHPHPEIIHALLPETTVNQVVLHWEQPGGTDAAMVNVSPVPAGVSGPQVFNTPTPVSASTEAMGETESGETEGLPTAETAGETGMTSSAQLDDSLHKACDICGETSASLWCRLCDNKQLCGVCDDMWHKHPKRQNHQREPIASLPSPSSAPQQDPIRGPFGIRAMNSISTHNREGGERTPTPVSRRPSTSSEGHSRTPPPGPSRTPPPQQIEGELYSGATVSSPRPVPLHQGGGNQGSPQSSAPVSPSASIYMHQQQLFHYQRLLQQQQQQEQQQQQRLQQQQQQQQNEGGVRDYYVSAYGQGGGGSQPHTPPASQPSAAYPNTTVHNPPFSQVSAQHPGFLHTAAHNSGYPPAQSAMGRPENWMYGNLPTETAGLPPFPMLEPDPISGGASARALPNQRLSQAGEPDPSSKMPVTAMMPGGAGAGAGAYADMSLRQLTWAESARNAVPPATFNLPGHRLERRHSGHLPYAATAGREQPSLSESSLLKTVLAETDYEKRAAKCDVRLLTLEEDLQEVEGLLNELMLNAEDVTECDDFRTLNRRKARLMKEHRALSDYRRELADLMLAEGPRTSPDPNRGPHPATQVFHPPPLIPASSSSPSFPSAQGSPMVPVSTSPTQQHLGFSYPHQASQSPVHPQEPVPISVYHPPLVHSSSQQVTPMAYPSPAMQESSSHQPFANSSVDRSSILPQWQMGINSSAPTTIHNPLYSAPPRYQQGDTSGMIQSSIYGVQQMGSRTSAPLWGQASDPSFSALGQGGTRMPVAQEHGLPSSTQPSGKDVNRPSHMQNRQTLDQSYGVLGQPLGLTQIGFENLMGQELNCPSSHTNHSPNHPLSQPLPSLQASQQARKSHTPSPPPPSTRAPPPPSVTTSSSSASSSSHPLSKKEAPAQQWQCSHCTFINEPGNRVCVMCDRTSDNPTLISGPPSIAQADLLSSSSSQGVGESAETSSSLPLLSSGEASGGGSEVVGAGLLTPEQLAYFQSTIVGDQDQVYLEKQEAHKQFNQTQAPPTSAPSAPTPPLTNPPSIPPPLPPRDQMPQVTIPPVPPRTSRPSTNQGQAENRQSEDKRQESTERASPSPAGAREMGETESPQVNSLDLNFVQEGDFSITMERFQEQRQMKQIKLDGADLLHYLKMGDREGFSVEELELALQQTGGPRAALEWLHSDWSKLSQVVMASTKAEGQRPEHNDVGELSAKEAKAALYQTKGDMMAAVNICVAQRKQMYQTLNPRKSFPREDVLQAMLAAQGDEDLARHHLQTTMLQPFMDRVWARQEEQGGGEGVAGSTLLEMTMSERSCQSVSTSIISHADFQQMVMDQNLDRERRIRLILVEGKLKSWGRAEMVIKLLDIDLPQTYPLPLNHLASSGGGEGPPYTLEDVVEAVRNCRDRQSARVYLTQECSTCFSHYPMSKIRNLNFCQCKMCQDCLKQNFEVVIREKHVRHWTCPICSHPDLNDVDIAEEYLTFLAMLLQTQVDKEVYDLFETKVRDWHLQKDPNFRWCAHCGNGFIADERHLRMECPHCKHTTCYSCKKQWEEQHEGLTCAQFEQWKIDNDPNNQAVGLARHLEENGIDCPSCKMRYALAKGGCMHFKCPQCGHEFCSGCYQPFYQRGVCASPHCKLGGLHAHHPRDCFFYLRDEDSQQLQDLLKESCVAFNTDPPEGQEDPGRCPVMEQKEFDKGKSDECCGKETSSGHAGLCLVHYKEYLVGLINRNHIDPIVLMSIDALKTLLKRSDLNCPKVSANESEANYRKRLIKLVKDKIPLPRQGP